MKNKLLFILAICFLVRLVYWYFWNRKHSPLEIPDTIEYIELGRSFIESGEFMVEGVPTAKRPPIYPMYLGLCHKLLGTNYNMWTFLQVIISSITGLLVFLIVKNIFNTQIGLVAFLLYSIDPLMVLKVPHISTEVLFAWLLMIAILMLILEQKYRAKCLPILCGLSLALPGLCRAEGISLLFVFPLFFLMANKINRESILRMLTILIFSIITLLPWVIRNYRTHKSFVLISTFGGSSFLTDTGAHPLRKDRYWEFLWKKIPVMEKSPMSEVLLDKICYEEKIKHILGHPLDGIRLVMKNFLILHYFTSFPQSSRYDPIYGFILSFAIIGFVLILRANWYSFIKVCYPVIMSYIGFSITYSLYTSDPRMRNSIELTFFVLASYGIVSIFNKYKFYKALLIVSLIVVVNLFLFFAYSNYVKPYLIKVLSLLIGLAMA